MSADASVQAVGVVLGSGISIVTFAAITRALGPATFGDFAAAIAYLAIPATVLDQGLTVSVVRDIARDPSRGERTLRASLPPRVALSAVVLAATVALAYALSFPDRMRLAILIGVVGYLAQLVGNGVVPLLQAELRMGWTVVAAVTGRLVTLGLTLAAVADDLGLEGVAWAYVIGAAVTALVQLAAVGRRTSIRPIIDLSYTRRLLRETAVLGSATGAGLVYWRIDSVLIALFRSSREVGLYAAAYKFADLTAAFASGIFTSLLGPLTRLLGEHDPRARGLLQRTFDILVAVSAPPAVLAAVFAPQIITLIAGDRFVAGEHALRVLALVPVFSLIGGLLERGLVAAGRERLVLVANLVVLTANVGLNLWLIPAFGYVAAAATTLATEVLWVAVGGAFFRRRLGFLPNVRSLGGIAVAAASMAAAALTTPGPAPVAATVSIACYLVLVVILPGAPRGVARDAGQDLVRRFRTAA
jgi:O-antigen/teichoic acid export membrane protein